MHKVSINFNWYTTEFSEVPPQYTQQLNEQAFNRIFEMLKEGFICGDLWETIDGINFKGGWDITNIVW